MVSSSSLSRGAKLIWLLVVDIVLVFVDGCVVALPLGRAVFFVVISVYCVFD